MALNIRRFDVGIQVRGVASSTISLAGEIEYLNSSNKLQLHNGSTISPFVTEAHTATLTNKTISGSSNTFSNIPDVALVVPYVKADGTRALTGNWAAGAFSITANSVIIGSTANQISGVASIINGAGTLTLPTSTDTLVGRATTDTLTNKTLSGASNTFSNIDDSSLSVSYVKADGTRPLTGNWAAGSFSITANSVIVGSAANRISGVSTIINGSGTLTLPTTTDTLVGRATTDTLTNKTLSGASNTFSSIPDGALSVPYIKADGTRALTANWAAGAFSITANSVIVGSAANQISGVATVINGAGTLTLPISTDTLVGRATTDTLTNKTLGDALTCTQVSTPSTPSAGFNKLYFKSDNILYSLTSSGTELAVGGGGGGGSGAGIDTINTFIAIKKLGQSSATINSESYIAEAFTDSTTLTLTPITDYTAGGTTIWLDQNKTQLDSMDATTGWTASVGAVASDAVNKLEGTNSVKHTVTSLNGSANISKAISFSATDKNFRARVYLDTITNLTNLNIKLESSAANDVTYNFVVANLSVGWNYLHVNLDAAPNASTGTFVRSQVTKVYLGLTTSLAQTVNLSWDDLVTVDKWDVINAQQTGLIIPIWDGTNQEFMILTAEDATFKGKYTLSAGLTNSYTRAASKAKLFGGTVSSAMNGEFDSTATGAHLKVQHFISRKLLSQNFAGSKTLSLTGTFVGDNFLITGFPTANSITIAGDQTARFKSGDKIVMFKWQKNYPGYASYYNSTLTNSWKILTLSGNSTVASSVTTIPHVESNSTGGDTSDWYVVRLSLFLKYFIGGLTANESLTTLTPSVFIPADNQNTIHTDSFQRANTGGQAGFGTAPNGQTYTVVNHGSTDTAWGSQIVANVAQDQDGGNGRFARIGNYLRGLSLTSNEYVIKFKYSLLDDGTGGSFADAGVSIFCPDQNGYTGGIWIGAEQFTAGSGRSLFVFKNGRNGSTVNSAVIQSQGYGNGHGSLGWVRAYINKATGIVRIATWKDGTQEPTGYTYEWSFGTTGLTLGNQIGLFSWTSDAAGGSASTHYYEFDVYSVGPGYTIGGSIVGVGGSKLVVDAQLDRQDTVNDASYIKKFGAILA